MDLDTISVEWLDAWRSLSATSMDTAQALRLCFLNTRGKAMEFSQLAFTEDNRSNTSFRPIHYMGIKTRALGAIERLMREVAPDGATVCDLFAGSGVVSARLASRFHVIASDIQEYSRVLTSAQINPSPEYTEGFIASLLSDAANNMTDLYTPVTKQVLLAEEAAIAYALDHNDVTTLAALFDLGSLEAATLNRMGPDEEFDSFRREHRETSRAVITRLYGGVYFSFRQTLEFDAISEAIRKLPESTRDTAIAALLSTASDLVSTVGSQFAQPIKPRTSSGDLKRTLLQKAARVRTRSAFELFRTWIWRYAKLRTTARHHSVRQQDFRDCLQALPSNVRAIYADPPYTRDHYSRFYHVLETLACLDQPGLSTTRHNGADVPSRAGYRSDRHQSPFSIASEVKEAFRVLFKHAKRLETPLILSYSPSNEGTVARPRPRLMTIQEIVDIGSGMGFRLNVTSAGQIAHSKFNSRGLNSSHSHDAEHLILALPPS